MYAVKTKVTRKYQITLPKEIREAMHVKIGDQIELVFQGGNVLIQRRKTTLEDITGDWDLPLTGKEYVEQIRERSRTRRLYAGTA